MDDKTYNLDNLISCSIVYGTVLIVFNRIKHKPTIKYQYFNTFIFNQQGILFINGFELIEVCYFK